MEDNIKGKINKISAINDEMNTVTPSVDIETRFNLIIFNISHTNAIPVEKRKQLMDKWKKLIEDDCERAIRQKNGRLSQVKERLEHLLLKDLKKKYKGYSDEDTRD